jgi:predicted ABC-type ATPase
VNGLVPRLRMFAGPNGSGKSTLKSYIPKELLGVYLNPDEIEDGIRRNGFLNLLDYEVRTTADKVLPFFTESELLNSAGLSQESRRLVFYDNRLDFANVKVNSYFASVMSDFLRRILMELQGTFTLETVMSHPSKIELLTTARQNGYRTYLYYVATEDPMINVARIKTRVLLGGHDVPEDHIIGRYYRSLKLLMDAIRRTDRAYIFDNSGENLANANSWLAEITDGRLLQLKSDQVPEWFRRSVLAKI